MSALLEDLLNLKILNSLCSGTGIAVNINEISKKFGKHRNTVKAKINEFFDHKIIDRPIYPLQWFFKKYHLLVIEKGDFPRDSKTNEWIEKDPYIWAAFFIKEEEYNTLLFGLHESLYAYQNWRESIIDEKKISMGEIRPYLSEVIISTAQSIIKFDPSASIQIMEENYRKGRHKRINGLKMDDFSFDLLKALLSGKGIRTNENLLAKKLDVHRITVQRRIDNLVKNKIISRPTCHFPRIWVPPEYFFVLSLVEIRKNKDLVLNTLKNDPHVPFIIKTYSGRYNLIIFSNFYRIEDHLAWQEEYDQRFNGSIGAVKNTYLSPAMTFSISQEYVSLVYLQKKLKESIVLGQQLSHKRY
ncbi:MAG: hypothetical protein ACXAEU_04470 [Candidatus Hodarchaeales archaeon]